jgi:hypothetical protein
MVTVESSTLVVIGFAEALAAPECVWSLVDAGCSVVAFTRRGAVSALAHSKHVRLVPIEAPEANTEAAGRELSALLDRLRQASNHACHVLMPLDDASLWLCGHAQAPGWSLAGATPASGLDVALDKALQTRLAAEAGFDLPATRSLESPADLEGSALAFPLILRSAFAVSHVDSRLRKGRNWICNDQRELDAACRTWAGRGRLLLQPYVVGTGEGLFGLMTDEGVIAWSAHRRLRMMNPHGSGSSACVSMPVDEALKAPATRFLSQAGWRGPFMFELLRCDDGRAVFVEFNGRPWGSMALARRQGFEYPAWAARQASSGSQALPAPPSPRAGIVCRHLGRELMHLLFVMRGRKSQALRSWPSLGSTLRAVMLPRRGDTFYNWRRNDWRVFTSDCWYTLSRHWRKAG